MHPTHPRRRSWPTVLLLLVTALLVALAAVVVVASPAGASHTLGGTEPSNYQLVQLAGAWIEARPPLAGKLLSLGASAAGWVLAALAVRQLLRRRLESGLFQLLLAAGLLTLVSGLGDLGFLLRSQFASVLPDQLVRAAVPAKLGLGLGALAAAALQLRVLLAAQPRSGVEDVRPGPGAECAQLDDAPPGPLLWHWDDEPFDLDDLEGWDDPAPLGERFGPALHVVGGRASRRPEPASAASGSTSATVLPWPSHRRPPTVFDDPDLPGGA